MTLLISLSLVAAHSAENDDVVKQFSDQQLLEIGKEVYHSPGANTCQDCHGVTGEHGSRVEAANLTKPKTWRSYRALNGDWAKMDISLQYLIQYSALKWNFHFAKEHPDIKYDWSKAGEDRYNSLMYGETQPAMVASLARIKGEIATKDKIQLTDDQMRALGAAAALRYVKTLSTQ
ncbi:MAG TPA: hypothetical protein VMI10_10165 [Terriglobales bacterium]|nr:hypothetical protein [Terriglobales bacterium]